LNTPPVTDFVPVEPVLVGNITKVNVPTAFVDVTLVIVTLPLPLIAGWL
jgi:hypothetical protein